MTLEKITWSGKLRAPLSDRGVYPRPVQKQIPVWIAVGGAPQSVVRAATLGLPMALAIIGGDPVRFAPYFALYRDSAQKAGHDPKTLGLSLNMHGFVAETREKAKSTFYGPQAEVMTQIGRERGWGPQTREHFEQAAGPNGNLVIGSPEDVAEKIVGLHKVFGNSRILIQMAIGSMPHAKVLKAIELLGTKVSPLVHAAVK